MISDIVYSKWTSNFESMYICGIAKLSRGSVQTDKISRGSVQREKISRGSVQMEISRGSVQTEKTSRGSVQDL